MYDLIPKILDAHNERIDNEMDNWGEDIDTSVGALLFIGRALEKVAGELVALRHAIVNRSNNNA
jgi:hypothetical protein